MTNSPIANSQWLRAVTIGNLGEPTYAFQGEL
jgi:hypothetical protein